MIDKRDLRDPNSVGEVLFNLREKAPKREKVGDTYDRNHATMLAIENYDAQHLGPVEKYGTPGDHEPEWAYIQVR